MATLVAAADPALRRCQPTPEARPRPRRAWDARSAGDLRGQSFKVTNAGLTAAGMGRMRGQGEAVESLASASRVWLSVPLARQRRLTDCAHLSRLL